LKKIRKLIGTAEGKRCKNEGTMSRDRKSSPHNHLLDLKRATVPEKGGREATVRAGANTGKRPRLFTKGRSFNTNPKKQLTEKPGGGEEFRAALQQLGKKLPSGGKNKHNKTPSLRSSFEGREKKFFHKTDKKTKT